MINDSTVNNIIVSSNLCAWQTLAVRYQIKGTKDNKKGIITDQVVVRINVSNVASILKKTMVSIAAKKPNGAETKDAQNIAVFVCNQVPLPPIALHMNHMAIEDK